MKLKYTLLILLFPLILFSQNIIKDTVYGNVKSVREKMIFLDSIRQNYKLFEIEDEYGHHGFMNREFALSRNMIFWYNLPWVHYVNYYREYNEKNQITNETWYYKNGDFLTSYKFKYNTDGKLIEELELDKNHTAEVTKKWGYDYKGRLATKLRFYNDDDSYVFENYEYDNENNLIEEGFFNNERKQSVIKHEYINNKLNKTFIYKPYTLIDGENPKRKTKIDNKWSDILMNEYKYDDKGNKIISIDYRAQMEGAIIPPSIQNYKYDSNNMLIEVSTNNSNSKKFIYNSQKQLVKYNTSIKDTILEANEYIYNNGNLVKMIYTEDKSWTSISEFEYKFDIHNNWIEQIKIVDGKRLYIRKREIKYY